MKTIFSNVLFITFSIVLFTGFRPLTVKRLPADTHEISIQRANGMIRQYLQSAPAGETRSLFATADTIRRFLANQNIHRLKFFLARRGDSTLTLIIAGIDANGNYVYGPTGGVYDELMPCPPECPEGEGGSDLLPE